MSTTAPRNEPGRGVLWTAVAATVVIAVGAFILSFAALTDLATRSGIHANLAWIWPIIVDGMIVAATVAIVALNGHGKRAMWYPWALLFFGAIVSTAANSTHAILTVDGTNSGIPPIVSALVAAMPPVVLLAITHLTVHMYQKRAEVIQQKLNDAYEEAEAAREHLRQLQIRRASAEAAMAQALRDGQNPGDHASEVAALDAELAALTAQAAEAAQYDDAEYGR